METRLNTYMVISTFFIFLSCSTKVDNGANLDQFGGWKEKKLTETGFFHTEHDGDRWWFVTPEGHAFLSFGINQYHAGWWNQEYNQDHWNGQFGAENVQKSVQ